jgi:rod shape-determining protein MreC
MQLDSSVVVSGQRGGYKFQFVPSRVVRNSVYKQYNYLTLDHGKEDGVFKDMGVISDRGVVGIVLESSDNFATVIPIINLDFRLSVKLKSNNYAGILQWDGKTPLFAVLNEIPFHVELTDGDTIVTSGFSSIFPEGIEVGTIESFSLEKGNFYEIEVRLSTDFQSLFHVNVIRNYQKEEQLNLEGRDG